MAEEEQEVQEVEDLGVTLMAMVAEVAEVREAGQAEHTLLPPLLEVQEIAAGQAAAELAEGVAEQLVAQRLLKATQPSPLCLRAAEVAAEAGAAEVAAEAVPPEAPREIASEVAVEVQVTPAVRGVPAEVFQ